MKTVAFESYLELGYNYRMTDLQAAVGREQLKRLPAMLDRRRFLAARYRELGKSIPGIALPQDPPWARSNWQSYCVRLPERCSQRDVMQKMLDFGIATRPGIMCAHREPAYQNQPWSCGEESHARVRKLEPCSCLVESEKAQSSSILLPLFHQMTEEDQERIVAALRAACA
jgi:dTDP-4-amino-4,6-dideoxygalactose transaminase